MDFFKQVMGQFSNMFQGLSAGKKGVFLVILVGAVAGLITLVVISQKPTYELLYSNLSPQDAGVIISKLKEQKVPYRLSGGGTSILVPSEQVYEVRMDLASEGMPQGGGVGFEIFDHTKLGMTEFVQTVNYQRALQGELTRTINQLAEVEQSRIHIVIPQKSLFIEDQEEASASVVLKLRGGAVLSQNQIHGIVHLVASSVEGLRPEKITIMDNHGRILAGGTEKPLSTQLSHSQVEMKLNLERALEKGIVSMLERAVGKERALAKVFLSLDFKQTERTEEKYDPDSLAVRSEQVLGEKSKGSNLLAKGIPGVESNLSGDKGVSAAAPSEFQRKNETINYEISKTTSHIIEPTGDIVKCSVAVMIDGTYGPAKGEGGQGEMNYIPRTNEEMERFREIVKMAVGYDADRGDQIEVINVPFQKVNLMGEEIDEGSGLNRLLAPVPLFRFGIITMAIILLFFFVLRPLIRWMISQNGELEGMRQLPRTVGELEAGVAGEVESKEILSPKEKIMELAKGDTEQTTQLVRRWLWEGK